MKVLTSILLGLLVVGCGKEGDGNTGVVKPNSSSPEGTPKKLIADPIVEKKIRWILKKTTGELTETDLKEITELAFMGQKTTDVRGLENLTRLWLSNNQLTELPKGLENLTQLEFLSLDGNQLTDVKGLQKLTQLTELDLTYNQLADVKGLENLKLLKELYLPGNKLTDVKGLEKLTQLTALGLPENQLTDVKGLEKLTQLKQLHLAHNFLTDVKDLEKLTQLEKLHLGDNPDLTKAQIDELQKALPKCKIFHNAK